MKRNTTGTSPLQRMKPLAACLAMALSMGSGMVAAETQAPSNSAIVSARSQPVTAGSGIDWAVPKRRSTDPIAANLRWHPAAHLIPAIPAASFPVTNCNDSGPGSLREASLDAVSGDTVDLTATGCSLISLTTGAILFLQTDITLQGPGSNSLYISGNNSYAPLLHGGGGTFEVNDLTVLDGMKYFTGATTNAAKGGCIYSTGEVSLSGTEVKYCTAKNTGAVYGAKGGAVYGKTGVVMSNSSVIGGTASAPNSYAWGGGVYSPGFVTMADSVVSGSSADTVAGGVWAKGGGTLKYSTIANNQASVVGGFYALGNATILNSTITGNRADNTGGMWLNGTGATVALTVLSSTISGNTATKTGGAFVYGGGYTARIANSTIAFNTESGSTKYGAGLRTYPDTIDLESTIIATNSNTLSGLQDDIGQDGSGSTLIGANNLIGFSALTPPSDTISADPELLPLGDNGGETYTHALGDSSPAINAGNNNASVSFDQRGPGYPRVIGAHPDIGAFELDTSDIIFANGFE